MTPLSLVREAVERVVPEIDVGEIVTARGASIGLADVLRAILQSRFAIEPIELTNKQTVLIISDAAVGPNEDTYCEWDLTQPLEGQSQECLEFLAKLLT